MNLRQCFALGVICGLLCLLTFIFYRQRGFAFIERFGRPIIILFITVFSTLFVLAILFATPVLEEDLQALYYIFLITIGVGQTFIGGPAYFFYSSRIAEQIDVPENVFFQRDLAVVYIALGVMNCVAGSIQDGALPCVIFATLFSWGRLVSHLQHSYNHASNTNVKDKDKDNDNDVEPQIQKIEKDGIGLCLFEVFANTLVPIILLLLYIAGFTFA